MKTESSADLRNTKELKTFSRNHLKISETKSRKHLFEYSDKNYHFENFLSEEERYDIFNLQKLPQGDTQGRYPSIFKVQSAKYEELLERRLVSLMFPDEDPSIFTIKNSLSLLNLEQPTKPHVDGNYPHENRFYIIKSCVALLAFDTEEDDVDDLTTSLITFKQHLNEYKRGGMELDYCFEHNTVPKFWEDFKGNRLENHKNSFIPKGEEKDYQHVTFTHEGQMQYGLDIDKEIVMHLGDLATFNPYQMHMTKGYDELIPGGKWALRIILYKRIHE